MSRLERVYIVELAGGGYWAHVYADHAHAVRDVEAQALKDDAPVASWQEGSWVMIAVDKDGENLYKIVPLGVEYSPRR